MMTGGTCIPILHWRNNLSGLTSKAVTLLFAHVSTLETVSRGVNEKQNSTTRLKRNCITKSLWNRFVCVCRKRWPRPCCGCSRCWIVISSSYNFPQLIAVTGPYSYMSSFTHMLTYYLHLPTLARPNRFPS